MKARTRWKPTCAERKAMQKEIDRQIVEIDNQYKRDLVNLVLWSLHVCPDTKWGKVKLKRYYQLFDKIHQDMIDHYELRDDDAPWLAGHMLKEIGVDIDEWEKELNDKN
jgi:hypothetical protein